ncbi:MAG: hypothetical protein BAJATHORv1_30196 [Candidatus Thorarchaeota archaeon]|nr:MAG: hypothetical protein BAJATHORv1_30196 [Candidatus Thorarchaeota archaeon]
MFSLFLETDMRYLALATLNLVHVRLKKQLIVCPKEFLYYLCRGTNSHQ